MDNHFTMQRKIRLPLSLRMIQGAIGKRFVIKHYRYGVIKTKYPDMTRIIASAKQRVRRNLFKDAVAFAQGVLADKARAKEWQQRIRRRSGVYNAAIKFFMRKDKQDRERAELLANRLLFLAMRDAACFKGGNANADLPAVRLTMVPQLQNSPSQPPVNGRS